MNRSLAEKWASSLGLIDAPLFRETAGAVEHHSVLLNGGRGSFALSVSEESEIDDDIAASWIWSADLPHHVVVDENHVTLSRWDDPTSTRRFSRNSVERRLEPFYKFLRLDQVRSRFDIVEHSIDVFRRIRSRTHELEIDDEASIHVFLLVLALMLDGQEETFELEKVVSSYALNPYYLDVYRGFDIDTLQSLVAQFRSPEETSRELEVVPQLLVRHASGTVFQEAHFEFVRGDQTNLFGLPGSATVKIDTRGGTHFTPPGLARSIVEQALGEIETDDITVLDPSCGAGAFLHEVLRFLKRRGYTGNVTLFGYDISPNAVAMARFALVQAQKDWPEGKIKGIHVESRDSLDDSFTWPDADVILMNPPFISWGGMSKMQREQVRSILAQGYTGRPDYSMAFIQKALDSIKSEGIVGTLMPSSILSSGASLRWRERILDQAVPEYLAMLGDHTLFRHAIVEAAYAIFAKREEKPEDRIVALWTSEKRGTAGEALRNLRKFASKEPQKPGITTPALQSDQEWRISVLDADRLRYTPDWRPRPNRLENILNEIEKAFETTVGDLFHVREGVRAGMRKAFVISAEDYACLPSREHPYFRPVAETRNIQNGRILLRDYIFYPNTAGLERIQDETSLQRLLPKYYERFLLANREELAERAGLRGRDWWVLNWHRSWLEQPEPKLVSSYFGDVGRFAWDEAGNYVVVQGFGWLARAPIQQELNFLPEGIQDEYQATVFDAYLALLNSSLFSSLLAEFCPHVAGGQYNLSKRFVDRIPMPNLATFGLESSSLGSTIKALAEEGEKIRLSGLDSIYQPFVDRLVAEVYHVPFEAWPETNR